jgi:hypothetical protein
MADLFATAPDSAPLPGEVAQGNTPGPGATEEFQGAQTDGLPEAAKTITELQAQIAQLIQAFQQSENRLPTPTDSQFWSAYNTLVQRYQIAYEPETFPARVG